MTETVIVALIGVSATLVTALFTFLATTRKTKMDAASGVTGAYKELVDQFRGIVRDQQQQIDGLVDELKETRDQLREATQKLDEATHAVETRDEELRRLKAMYNLT